jgi:hypothetical protein
MAIPPGRTASTALVLRRLHLVREAWPRTVRPYHASDDLNTQGRGKQAKFSYSSLSSSSKLKTYSIGSSISFVFNSIPRTHSKYGTFPPILNFYPQMLALDFAIIHYARYHIQWEISSWQISGLSCIKVSRWQIGFFVTYDHTCMTASARVMVNLHG